MPISKYFGGHGAAVKRDLQKKYGKNWEEHFYAIANAKGQNPHRSIATKGKKK